MNHETWEIPVAEQRTRGQQSLDDLRFTLVLFWNYLVGPFVAAPTPLTPPAEKRRTPIIIVPGFICRPAIYRPLQAVLNAAGFECHILDLGYQVSSIYRKAERLSEYIDTIGATQVYVIAHSMGGLILTTCIYQGEQRIRHGWALGAPIWGTNIVYVVYALVLLVLLTNLGGGWGWYLVIAALFLSSGLRQMLPGSDLIAFTSKKYGEMDNVTAVFCAMDMIVFSDPRKEPGSSSRFGRESDVLFPEAGHNNIVMGDNAIRCIRGALLARDGND